VFAIVIFSVVASVKSTSVAKAPAPATVRVPAVTTFPVEPLTVKLEVSTAMPPSRFTRVVVVAPRPVTVERVSASEVLVEEIVIVDPEVETEVAPDPLIVRVPAWSLTLVTSSVSSTEIVGVWPPVTAIPVPPVMPYTTLGAVMGSKNVAVPEISVSASIYNLWFSEVAARTVPRDPFDVPSCLDRSPAFFALWFILVPAKMAAETKPVMTVIVTMPRIM